MTAFFVVFQVDATLQLHRHSFESFGLGPLFPDNPNCGLFLVFLLGSMSSLKRFASYLFRHSQTEISPICHVMTCVTRIKLLHLLAPLLIATFIVPLISSLQIFDIALGLKNLHGLDIVHGDLRAVCPYSCYLSQLFILFQSNVLRSEGHCHLVDFGIAKMPTMSTLATFAKLVHCGWAAPELDQQPRSKRSDIFSFACTIYEVLISCLFI